MSHVFYRNCNDAFRHLVTDFAGEHQDGYIRTKSRAGDVIQYMPPLIVTYERPRERVLFNAARDANPFFHLFESLWMLAGRNDVAKLSYYSSKIADIASDDGETFNGAYGYRWRNGRYTAHLDGSTEVADQLAIIIDQLKRKPESRRVVLSMWNVEDDLLKIDVTKDVCCNTHAYFLLRKERKSDLDPRRFATREEARQASTEKWGTPDHIRFSTDSRKFFVYNDNVEVTYLDMTVCNRSNDLILGMLGANVVHFSVLQEYLAAHIGVEVGLYHQFTNNLHVYTSNWRPVDWLADTTIDYYGKGVEPFPLVSNPEQFDKELMLFVDQVMAREAYVSAGAFTEPFFKNVAHPMAVAFWLHKHREYDDAEVAASSIAANDWKTACHQWILWRKAKWQNRNPYLDSELKRMEADNQS